MVNSTVTTDIHSTNKNIIAKLRKAQTDFTEAGVRNALREILLPDADVHMPYPFGDLVGPDDFFDTCYAPLFKAMPDLERRDWIVIGGQTEHCDDWIGCDIPEVMIQANAWPMAPSLGVEFCIPGPATNDGLVSGPWDNEHANASCDHIVTMLKYMKKYPSQGGMDVMEMPRFWHDRVNWYGPAGIGTARGIAGFRNWHQIPFINAMPDRGKYVDQITYHFFGDKNYAAVTGWPNMIQTITNDGWMGIAPSGKRITMKSLDFWRIENGKIRENWVMVDLLDVYNQLGVNVFNRLREFNKARIRGRLSFPIEEK